MLASDARFLRTFQSWLENMGREVGALSQLLEAPEAPSGLRQACAEALEYLFRSWELIPEGLEDLGYLQDLFAFRVLAERAVQADPDAASFDASGTVARLAADASVVAEFLGEDYGLLQAATFSGGPLRREGRRAEDFNSSPELLAGALSDVRSWVEQYRAPVLASGAEELVKIGSFFRTRLRRAS